MENFLVLLRFEWKKITGSKVAILSLLGAGGLFLGFTLLQYLVLNPYDAHVYEREQDLEGRPLDDALLLEVEKEAEKAGGLTKIQEESVYSHVSRYLSRLEGTYLTIGGIPAKSLNEEGKESEGSSLEESLYAQREAILEYLYDYFGLSDSDKAFWREKEEKIPKPFIWKAHQTFYAMKSNFGASLDLFCILAGVSLAGVFAVEKSQKTAPLVLCTMEGRKSLWLAKFLAGELYALFAATVLLACMQLPHVLFNGLHGAEASWQLLAPFSSYTETAGEMMVLWIILYYLACLLVGAVVMFLSILTGHTMLTAGIICVSLILDMFVSLPPSLGLLSQLRYMTPGQVLINSSMTQVRLFTILGHKLTSYGSTLLLYILLMPFLIVGIWRKSRRWEA